MGGAHHGTQVTTAHGLMMVWGTVVHGKGEGRTLGYPTANLSFTRGEMPEAGVWACRVLVQRKMFLGALVVGMWEENNRASLEVHVLDYKENLYEQEVVIQCEKKIRDIQTFVDNAALKEQIEKDIKNIRAMFL